MNDDRSERENAIARFFARDYSKEAKPANLEDFGDSSKMHVEQILEINAKSALDVGMGAGGILLALQNRGVEQIHGVELSAEGIELAKKRFDKFGNLENTHFFTGSFLDYDAPQLDAVSIHMVLCCHPDYKGMIGKSVEGQPTLIVNSMPRRTLLTRFVRGLLVIIDRITFRKVFKGYMAYIHDPENVKKILEHNNYELVHSKKRFITETSVYRLKE